MRAWMVAGALAVLSLLGAAFLVLALRTLPEPCPTASYEVQQGSRAVVWVRRGAVWDLTGRLGGLVKWTDYGNVIVVVVKR